MSEVLNEDSFWQRRNGVRMTRPSSTKMVKKQLNRQWSGSRKDSQNYEGRQLGECQVLRVFTHQDPNSMVVLGWPLFIYLMLLEVPDDCRMVFNHLTLTNIAARSHLTRCRAHM